MEACSELGRHEPATFGLDVLEAAADRSPEADANSIGDGGAHFEIGARVRLGYDWRWLGFQVGFLGWEGLGSGSDPASHLGLLPDAYLRIGPRDVLRGEIGLGAYNAPTVLRPGLYVGLGVNGGQGWDVMGHLGVHAPMGSLHANSQARADLEVRAPVAERIRVGFGAALTSGFQHVEPEGRGLVAAEF